jgi:predicted ribosome quality control (RQC) complex YloA/Tae2 family protein
MIAGSRLTVNSPLVPVLALPYIRPVQTALHILSLVSELKTEAKGGTIVNTEFYRKERAAWFFIRKDGTHSALGFVYHPAGSGFYLVPASKLKLETREKPWPIFDLHGGEVIDIKQLGLDRIFYLTVRKNDTTQHVMFETIGPNGNIWLLDDRFGRQAVLRNRDYTQGERYESSPLAGRLNPLELTAPAMQELLHLHSHSANLALFVEKNLIGFNRTLAREAVKRAGLVDVSLADLDISRIESLANEIRDIAERFREPHAGYLYTIAGGAEVYPFKLSLVDEPPEKFKTLSLAVMAMTGRRQTKVEEADQRKSTLEVVDKAVARLSRRILKLEHDIKEASDFEKYRKLGELLQINFSLIKRGLRSLKVPDIFSDARDLVNIPLDPALTPRDNVEAYFRKHRKGREGLELLERRLVVTREELGELEKIRVELERNFDGAFEQYRNELTALVPREVRAESPQPRLPYREYKLSTGVTIFVGRDGSDNDRTTFEFAKPYELWFHTQQCAGSHVVLKFPNKSFVPSKREIEETAAIAAHFSKAKNDSLVPVAYTERRYVRKPRNAKPGLVTIEREKSVMVPPRKPTEK